MNDNLQRQWEEVKLELSIRFADGAALDMDGILYLIGVQELGKGFKKFSKDEKIDLMHIAICRLLEPYGYYEFDLRDSDGWPHFKIVKQLPELDPEAQTALMKEAVVAYFR